MKPLYRYQMDFNGKYTRWSLLSMGISFFLFMVYTFGVCNLADAGFFKALFLMLIPAVLAAGYVVMLKIKELNAPGIYGLIGAGLCLCMLISTFFTGSIIRIILGVIWYAVCAVLLLACVGGYLPSVAPATIVFGIAVVARFIILLFAGAGLETFILNLAVVFCFASLLFLPLSLKQGRLKNE